MTTVKEIGPCAFMATVNGRQYGPFVSFTAEQAVVVAEKMDRAMRTTVVEFDGE